MLALIKKRWFQTVSFIVMILAVITVPWLIGHRLKVSEEDVVGRFNIFQDNQALEHGFMPQIRRVYEQGGTTRFMLPYDTARIEGLELSRSATAFLDVTISAVQDAQGKTTAAALKGLFHPPYDPAVTEPQVLESVLGPDGLTLRLRVPEDLGYLDGHFPEFPVVPGVVQTKWVWAAAATLLGRVPEVRALEAVKFKELLLPGRAFSLRVHRQRKAGSDKLCYELTDGDVLFSSGRFLLGAPSTGPAEPGA